MASVVTITRKVSAIGGDGKWFGSLETVVFDITCHTDGSVTSVQTDKAVIGKVVGFITNPGSPAPTDQYDITITNEDGADILGGVGANRHTSNSEYAIPVMGTYFNPYVNDKLTINVTNNSVSGAKFVAKLLVASA